MSKKISIFLPNMGGGGGGGAQRCLGFVANGLAEKGHSVDMVLAQAEGPYLSELSNQLRIIDLAARRVQYSLPKWLSYVRKEKPAVMMSTLVHTNIATIAAREILRHPAKVIIREDNSYYSDPDHLKKMLHDSTLAVRLAHRMVPRLYPKADTIIGVSEGVSQGLLRALPLASHQVKTIYNPIITPALHEQAKEFPNHHWFQETIPIFVAVGRLWKQKNYPLLIRAFKDVVEKTSARLIILGEGPERDTLENLRTQLKLDTSVDLPGFVQNPFSFLSHATGYVMSSSWEGLPGTLIQALACGCPAISTDCPSGPSEILKGGAYGSLIPVNDSKALTEAMLGLLKNHPPKSLPAEWLDQFKPDKIIKQYSDLI